MQQEVRSCFGEECGNVGSGPENENQTVRGKGEGEKKLVRCEILGYQGKFRFSIKKESWCEEGVDDGFSSRENMAPTERLKLRRQMATAAGKSRFRFHFSWN